MAVKAAVKAVEIQLGLVDMGRLIQPLSPALDPLHQRRKEMLDPTVFHGARGAVRWRRMHSSARENRKSREVKDDPEDIDSAPAFELMQCQAGARAVVDDAEKGPVASGWFRQVSHVERPNQIPRHFARRRVLEIAT